MGWNDFGTECTDDLLELLRPWPSKGLPNRTRSKIHLHRGAWATAASSRTVATLLASSVWSTALIQVMRGLPNNIVIHNVCCVAKLARKVCPATDTVLGECISQDQQSDLSKDMQDQMLDCVVRHCCVAFGGVAKCVASCAIVVRH